TPSAAWQASRRRRRARARRPRARPRSPAGVRRAAARLPRSRARVERQLSLPRTPAAACQLERAMPAASPPGSGGGALRRARPCTALGAQALEDAAPPVLLEASVQPPDLRQDRVRHRLLLLARGVLDPLPADRVPVL